ncbi:ABC transporter permease subunit [Candidatus Gracilibacteria bacterium]|nr:ABC transporter permease subunit [Candidatus Gracilibacteria bacterium]
MRKVWGALALIGESRISFDAYRNLLGGATPTAREFWPALAFSLWVSVASTLLASVGALLMAAALSGRQRTEGPTLFVLNVNLAFPHLVWAVALSLLLAQSGLLARIAAALGLIDAPAGFPVLVRDRYGLGIIIHYVSKEIPFLVLIVLAVLRTQGAAFDLVAENLGANRWQRLRYVTFPLVLPALIAGAAVVFAFVFGAYEVPALLGVRYPRTLSVLALEFFVNPDLNRRAEGMAIGLLISLITLIVVGMVHVGRRAQSVGRRG